VEVIKKYVVCLENTCTAKIKIKIRVSNLKNMAFKKNYREQLEESLGKCDKRTGYLFKRQSFQK